MNKLSKWLFGDRDYHVLLIGDRGCGKTTLVDRLKFNEVGESVAATIGSSVETIYYPTNCSWHIWEFRATRQLLDVARKQLNARTLVVWLHDCEADMTPPAIFSWWLQEMVEHECRYVWIAFNKQDARKVTRGSVQRLRLTYEQNLAVFKDQLSVKILMHKLSGKTGEGVIEVLDEMHSTMRKVKLPDLPNSMYKKDESATQQLEIRMVSIKELESRVEKEIRDDTLDADAFWKFFLAGDLPGWNHYNHLKAGYYIILGSAKKKNVFEMADDFIIHLHRLKKHSPKLFSNSPHQTLTVFWLLQIQHAIRDYRAHTMMDDLPSRAEFHQVLRHSPSLMDSHLWQTYYHNDALFKPAARDRWLPPLRRPLTTVTCYLRDPAIIATTCKPPDRLIRYAFVVMQHVQRSGASRSEVIAQALATLQQTTIRLRTLDECIPPYSETQAYFWVQMVHAALQSLDIEKESQESPSASQLTFSAFEEMFDLNATIWREYYSKKVWNSLSARSLFVLPDIQPLPNVIAANSAAARKTFERSDGSHQTQLPSIEELSFQAALVIHEAAKHPSKSSESTITSHAHLLLYLYTNLVKDGDEDAQKQTSLAQRERVLFREMSGPLVEPATHRHFWIHQVGNEIFHAKLDGSLTPFPNFLMNHLHLVFEGLPGIYYSPEVWCSSTAREKVVGPDQRRLAGDAELGPLTEMQDWVHVD